MPKILSITYRRKNILDIFQLTVLEAFQFFSDKKEIVAHLEVLRQVGLEYLSLGQSVSTLSGGEAQRLKLASHIAEGTKPKSKRKNIFFLFDEPTTGLHLYDIQKLLQCYQRLIETGNSVLVIEHNLDLIGHCDYLIDLGPEGGDEGGKVIAVGPPEDIMAQDSSYTGRYLREYLVKNSLGKMSRVL